MQYIILTAVGLVTFILLVAKHETRKNLLYAGLFSIAVGHRSIYIGYITYLVPLEIIFIVMFIYTFAGNMKTRDNLEVKLPFMLVFVVFLASISGLFSWINGTDWDSIVAWTLPLAIGVPAFWIIRRYIRKPKELSVTLKILLYVSTLMSALALIEYFYPSVAKILPQIFSGKYIITSDGFVRASFSFWGYPSGAIVVTWGMLIAYHEILAPKNSLFPRLVYWGILILGGAAVYVSGQRSSWIGIAFAMILLSLRGRSRGLIGIVIVYVTANILPAVFWQRFSTITDYLERGAVDDSSIGGRLLRWSWAWETTVNYPFGAGYGHWLAHNAFLEISSTIGIFAAIVFAIFVIQLIFRIANTALYGTTPDVRNYAWLFLAISVTWVIQFNLETVFQTPPLALAFWPYMALAWYLPDLFKEEQDIKPQLYKRLYRRSLR